MSQSDWESKERVGDDPETGGNATATSQNGSERVLKPLRNPEDIEKLVEKAQNIGKGPVRVSSLESLRGK